MNRYSLNDKELELKSDLAAEFPIYIYLSQNKDYLFYSQSIKELLDMKEVIKPLEVTSEGISFLLQSGVVPLPKTVYKNIFIVGVGDTAVAKTVNDKIEIDFSHKFPFFNKDRDEEVDIDEEYILEILAEATISKMEKEKPTYLFHSAGKDSNSIAIALAEAGYQDKVTCISHQSKGEKDESEISRKIATKLGFKHQKIYEPKKLEKEQLDSINHYFENVPLPCMDNVALAYPLYATQIEFNNTNMIDGGGNDIYMGYIPNKLEYDRQKTFSKFSKLRPIIGNLSSGTRCDIATSTRAEWASGLFGVTYGDTKKILINANNVYSFWNKESEKRYDWDYLDVKADIRSFAIESDQFQRKARNFADSYSINLIHPFANQKVAQYFSKLPEKYLFDRKEFKNKLILRKILKERIELDSDKLGKMAYEFDFYSILMMMKKDVDTEILSCKLWNNEGIEKVLNNLYKKINSNHRLAGRIKALVQRLYLLSAWYNKNKYIKR